MNIITRSLLAAGALSLCSTCREVDPTQLLLQVTAEPLARSRGRSLQVTFLDAQGAIQHQASSDLDPAAASENAIVLPTVIPVVPADADSKRVFRLIAELRDASGRIFNRYEGIGSFVQNRIVERRVVLADLCNDRICPSGQTCTDGACNDVAVISEPPPEPPSFDVGPGQRYATPCAAITAASPGAEVRIHAGIYSGEACIIPHDRLTIRGVDGRPIIDSVGALAEGRALWLVRASNVVLENLDLRGASATEPAIAAALLLEGTNLTLRDTALRNSQTGLYTNDDPESEVLVERCEVSDVGLAVGPDVSHGLRIGSIKRFSLIGSWLHDGIRGHLVRSQAADNWIESNRLASGTRTDPTTGGPLAASYELNFPRGGRAIVLGNVLQQNSATSNSAMLSYGEERDAPGPVDEYLYVAHDTFVSRRGNGAIFVRVANMAGEVRLINDIFAGNGTVTNFASPTLLGQCTDPSFPGEANLDYRLAANAGCVDRGVDPGSGSGYSLTPRTQPALPVGTEPRIQVGATLDPGAYEAP